ncbi:guanine deaminase [Pararhizobium haloflavum]|uniref:guanine deaminase n=1 Tax=Pararhizobium haloflavum TaxID=2037914 RepID=UPI000C1965ED|nr:guanine deaminase [Pararhizobium haloflavum]
MSEILIRGRVLTFNERPAGVEDDAAYRYLEDGAIHVIGGKIKAVGTFEELRLGARAADVVDHRPHLIVPGFIDTHLHFPQMQVVGSYGAQLLDWLNKYTFVEEQKFGDDDHAARIATAFFDELVRNGTTSAVAYCSVHRQSADAFFSEAERRGMLVIGGKVMMDRNAPAPLLDTAQSSYDDTKSLIDSWHGRGRARYAITPRFAITSTPEQMEAAGVLAREHPDCHIQTHLSENRDEIAFAKDLHGWARDYLDVYERYGLLGRKSLFGHSIHLSDREVGAMADSGSVAVFCPTSNLFLGSGLFDWSRMHQADVRVAVATDIGGGTSYSMLRTMDEAYKVAQLQGARINPLESFYQITLGNARALSLDNAIGRIVPGGDADFAVLDAGATPAMRLRMETATTLAEELFVLQTMGDDRAVDEVYVAGRAMKSMLGSKILGPAAAERGRQRVSA